MDYNFFGFRFLFVRISLLCPHFHIVTIFLLYFPVFVCAHHYVSQSFPPRDYFGFTFRFPFVRISLSLTHFGLETIFVLLSGFRLCASVYRSLISA